MLNNTTQKRYSFLKTNTKVKKIRKKLNNFVKTINLSPEYRLAFYTCFYGTRSNSGFKIPPLPSEKYDCYYFTNNKEMFEELQRTKWKAVFDNKPETADENESAMYAKYVKAMPHRSDFIKEYDYTCYLDSKLDKVSEIFVKERIDRYFVNSEKALLLRDHVFIKDADVMREYNESMFQQRYTKEKDRIMSYINKCLMKGLKQKIDKHSQTGLLIRNMKHPKINGINNKWYDDILECGIQCQVSFFFVKQIYGEHIVSFSENPFC